MDHATRPTRRVANPANSVAVLGRLLSEVFATLDEPEISQLIRKAERLAAVLPATTAADLVADLSYEALRGALAPVEPSYQLRYLLGVLDHHSHRRIRRLLQERRRDQYLVGPEARLPDDDAANQERNVAVRSAIAKLPPRRRIIVELYFMQQQSALEVAGLLGIKAQTVYQEVQRAKPILQTELREFSGRPFADV